MSKNWNLGDIKPSDAGRKPRRPRPSVAADMTPRRQEETPVREPVAQQPKKQRSYGRVGGRNKRTPVFIGGLAVVVIIVGVVVAGALGGATIAITPKTQEVAIDTTVTAAPNSPTGLSYEILTLEAEGERQVAVSGSEEVAEQAKGSITIYNEYSTKPQRLIKNTRFESPDGYIYRIQESVEVPGITKNEAGETVPGTVTAQVFSDGTGEEYNLGSTRFTIPGLEGTDQYDSMYARSTNTFTGGFEGEQYLIDESDLASAQDALHEELEAALRTRLEEEKPAGFVLLDGAVTFTYEPLASTDAGAGQASIHEKVYLVAPLFTKDGLGSFIAKNTVANYAGEEVELQTTDSLSITYTEDTDAIEDIRTAEQLSFQLTGSGTLVWQFDEDALRADLTGVSRTLLLSVLADYPAILRAEAQIHPFWKKSFPENSDNISFEVTIPE